MTKKLITILALSFAAFSAQANITSHHLLTMFQSPTATDRAAAIGYVQAIHDDHNGKTFCTIIKGPLPMDLVEALFKGFEAVKGHQPDYLKQNSANEVLLFQFKHTFPCRNKL